MSKSDQNWCRMLNNIFPACKLCKVSNLLFVQPLCCILIERKVSIQFFFICRYNGTLLWGIDFCIKSQWLLFWNDDSNRNNIEHLLFLFQKIFLIQSKKTWQENKMWPFWLKKYKHEFCSKNYHCSPSTKAKQTNKEHKNKNVEKNEMRQKMCVHNSQPTTKLYVIMEMRPKSGVVC